MSKPVKQVKKNDKSKQFMIPKNVFNRKVRKLTVLRFQKDAMEQLQEKFETMFHDDLVEYLKKAENFMKYGKRKTMTPEDVIYSTSFEG